MRTAISLGSNQGDRSANLQAAIAAVSALCSPGCPVAISEIRETTPIDCPPGSPNFLNAAIAIDWTRSPHELLDELQSIERRLGRPALRPFNSPRPIDLDILVIGDLQISDDRLTVPHPRLTTRSFVLEPLSEIWPNLILPNESRTIDQLGLSPNPARSLE